MEPMRPGAFITLDSMFYKILLEQWESEKLEPCLRFLVITCAMLYHEQGASRLILKRLFGNTLQEIDRTDTPHVYGCAADISIMELVDPHINDKNTFISRPFAKADWITSRINELFPFGDGRKQAAVYNLNHIHLEVPPGGFRKSTQSLATWFESGAVGMYKPPRRERRIS